MLSDMKRDFATLPKDNLTQDEVEKLYFIYSMFQCDARYRVYIQACTCMFGAAVVKGDLGQLLTDTVKMMEEREPK